VLLGAAPRHEPRRLSGERVPRAIGSAGGEDRRLGARVGERDREAARRAARPEQHRALLTRLAGERTQQVQESRAVRGLAPPSAGIESDRVHGAGAPCAVRDALEQWQHALLEGVGQVHAAHALLREIAQAGRELILRRAQRTRVARDPERGETRAMQLGRARERERVAEHREPHGAVHDAVRASRRSLRIMSAPNSAIATLVTWLCVTSTPQTVSASAPGS